MWDFSWPQRITNYKIISDIRCHLSSMLDIKELQKVLAGYDAFHEGIRLKKSVRYARGLVGKITHVCGDGIYATNANRTWCASQHIIHGFKRKGRAGKYED